MPAHIAGTLKAGKLRIGVIVARFNEFYTAKLLEGALDTLKRLGVRDSRIAVWHVPGSFEIPLAVKRLLRRRRYDALIAFGVILKGETRHFNHVTDAVSRGVLSASLESDVPVINGIVSALNGRQAAARIGGKLGHRGRDAAVSAVEMANLMKQAGK